MLVVTYPAVSWIILTSLIQALSLPRPGQPSGRTKSGQFLYIYIIYPTYIYIITTHLSTHILTYLLTLPRPGQSSDGPSQVSSLYTYIIYPTYIYIITTHISLERVYFCNAAFEKYMEVYFWKRFSGFYLQAFS